MPVPRTAPPHAVDRPELRSRLDAGARSPLTLVVAPAGAGKSVLLEQWAATLTDTLVGWVEMTDADVDPVAFARRLNAELMGLDPAFAELEHAPPPAMSSLGAPLLEALVGALSRAPGRVVVVFDDLHRTAGGDVVADLWRLVDLLPPNAHFVFASRVDLQLGWSRHRLEHGLVELRQSDLAFDGEGVAAVLEGITQRPIDPDTAAAVLARTEGWAAGVQLTGLGLRFRPDAREFVEALAESDRLVTDYLSEEVLDAQPAWRRQALLELSVLDELSPGLVEAVAGVDDGVTFLRDLARESMFVVPVPGEGDRFRFHLLFRELLRLRLRASHAGAEASLLRCAADWQLAHGDVERAVEALLDGRHFTAAVDLILSRGREVYERGQTATVARWLASVPPEQRRERVEAELLYAILEGMSGRAAITESIVRELVAGSDSTDGVKLVAQAYLAACVQFLPHPDVYLDAGRRALELLDRGADAPIPDLMRLTEPGLLETLAMGSVGRAHLFLGDTDAARSWLRRTLATAGASYGPYRVHLLGSLALADAWDGHLRRAADLSDEALELARQLELLAHPAPADAYLARSLVAIQRGQAEAGAFALHEGAARAAANGRNQLLWIAHAQARLVDPQATEMTATPPPTPAPPLVKDALEAIARRTDRQAGRPAAPSTRTRWSRVFYEDVAGLLAAGDVRAAQARLERLTLPEPVPPVVAVDLHLLGAWLALEAGRDSDARDRLRTALRRAEPEELVQPFLRAGESVLRLLADLPSEGEAFRGTILSRSGRRRVSAEGLSEPLTARELELLAYLPSRLTNAELAERCFVSVNTVKTHMAHIYRKLGVSRRSDAIVRARALGLLDDDLVRYR